MTDSNVSVTLNTTGADAFILMATGNNGSTFTPSDSTTMTWNEFGDMTYTDGAYTGNAIAFWAEGTGNASHTFNVTGTYPIIYILALKKNIAGTFTVIGNVLGTTSTSPYSVGPLSLTGTGTLGFGLLGVLNYDPPERVFTPDNGYTLGPYESSGNNWCGGILYKQLGSDTTTSLSVTNSQTTSSGRIQLFQIGITP